jgi:hypothetical protein
MTAGEMYLPFFAEFHRIYKVSPVHNVYQVSVIQNIFLRQRQWGKWASVRPLQVFSGFNICEHGDRLTAKKIDMDDQP